MVGGFEATLRKFFFPLSFSLIVCIHPACAYIGPGTAVLYFQIILGSIFTAMFMIKIYWAKIKDFIRRSRHRNEI